MKARLGIIGCFWERTSRASIVGRHDSDSLIRQRRSRRKGKKALEPRLCSGFLRRLIVHALAFFLLASGPRLGAQEETDSPPAAQPVHPLAGSWRWDFTMPDGTTTRPKLVLAVEKDKVAGTTTFRPGSETAITNAFLKGNELHFQVIRWRDGREIVTTYSGTWSDKEIRGKMESNWAGGKQAYDWLAQRAHFGAEGTWQWTNTFGTRSGSSTNSSSGDGSGRGSGRGRGWVSRVELEQEGETLTGWMPGRRRKVEIKNGTIRNGEIYFEVERELGGETFVTKYTGKQTGDAIKGTIETTTADGDERKSEWNARRVD